MFSMPIYKFSRENYLTEEEVKKMIERADEWLKSLMACLYIFGMRISEALSLTAQSFWIEGSYLNVKIPLKKKRKDTSPIVPSHVLRVNVETTPFAKLLLSHIQSKRPREKLWPYHKGHVWRKIKQLNKNCSPHFFRHSRLFHLAEQGASESALQDWAGWADPRPASRYVKGTGRLASQYADKVR